MSELKATPGPWEITNLTDVFTPTGATNRHGVTANDNDGWHVADCNMGLTHVGDEYVDLEYEEKKANAHLIAAAPEMYKVLQKEYELVLSANNYSDADIDINGTTQTSALKRILAKARGDL